MATKALTKGDLAQFTGSGTWYRHALVRDVLFTDGANYVADAGSALGFSMEIALAQRYQRGVAAEEFQVWTLKVADTTACLTCEDGNDNAVYAKRIDFTDFPLDEISLYFAGKTILLPSEY